MRQADDALEFEDTEPDEIELLQLPREGRIGSVARIWSAGWPTLSAVVLGVVVWQGIFLSGWRPSYVLPGPRAVALRVVSDLSSGVLARAIAVTMQRAAIGFSIALLIGTALGVSISQVALLRKAFGSLLAGLQTMPSIAWFPFAILLFQLSEASILFVVVLGAAPAIAGGLIHGIDHIPPILLRAGRALGARGLNSFRYIIFPAALPALVAGLKQGWAFAWRSLMAGELLVIIANRPSLGVRLQLSRELSDAEGLLATMLVIMLIGVAVDTMVFGKWAAVIRSRRGLTETTR